MCIIQDIVSRMHCLRGIYSSATISFISPCCHLAVVVISLLLYCITLFHGIYSSATSLSSHLAVISLLLSCCITLSPWYLFISNYLFRPTLLLSRCCCPA